MNRDDKRDALLDRDWSAVWESLPPAPDLVSRTKTAQVTLRLPSSLVTRIKRVASARGLPYHALARGWIVEAIRSSSPPRSTTTSVQTNDEQLNLKLDHAVLDDIKKRAGDLGRPYHRLSREWLEAAVEREEESLGIGPAPARALPLKDLIVLLLHSGKGGQEAIHGMTRLQKLLFVVEQRLASDSHFYAFNYGPFNEEVNDAAAALRLAGFLEGSSPMTARPPSFEEMLASAEQRAGPRESGEPEDFALSDRGHAAAEQLRRSNQAYERLFEYVREVRREWDTPRLSDLVDRVYSTWPEYAEKSHIRDDVAARSQKAPRGH